ncbi:MAG: tetratricopeptide repeat protein [Gemmatimonadales bacterium]
MENFKERAIEAELLRRSGDLGQAEESYRALIAWLEDADRDDLAGMLYITLGQIAEEAGRFSDAVAYYERAISTLEGLDVMDDEDGLQCAHAHYNIARILSSMGDDRFGSHVQQAIERYRSNPLASETDIRDAEQLAGAQTAESPQGAFRERFTSDEWVLVCRVPFDAWAWFALAGGEAEKAELGKLRKMLDPAPLEDPLHREMALDYAAGGTARIGEELKAIVDTTDFEARSRRTKSILQDKLTKQEYQSFFKSVCMSAVEMAGASRGWKEELATFADFWDFDPSFA